jgi:hypothetical protein
MIFKKIIFKNKKQEIEFLKKCQYTEEEIIKIINL